MTKQTLKQLALVGMIGGLMAGCSSSKKQVAAEDAHESGVDQAAAMSPEEFIAHLDDRHQALFETLDAEHQILALRMALQKCSGQNECAGLNSCRGTDNDCAGQGTCRGQGGCAFTDKGMIVRLAAKHMREKRNQINY